MKDKQINNIIENNIVIYDTEDGKAKVDVKYFGENLWLNMDEIALLYGKSKSTISEHIQNIFEENELIENEVMKKFGNSEFSKKPTNYYSLELIIAVGYRV